MDFRKRRFVRDVLKDEAGRMERNQELTMRKLLTFHTGHISSGRKFQVTSPDNSQGRLRFTFPAYLRFLDVKKKGSTSTRKRRKAFRIYNRFIYGHYFSIASRLASEYTNDVYLKIKSELKAH